jgi:ABC-type bacteriocin/lantibiotic exporter with double-glycine peptidase domain
MRPQLQSTAAECSIACLAMVADHVGLRMDLADLRCSLSLKGATLAQLMRYAAELNFTTRPLRLLRRTSFTLTSGLEVVFSRLLRHLRLRLLTRSKVA